MGGVQSCRTLLECTRSIAYEALNELAEKESVDQKELDDVKQRLRKGLLERLRGLSCGEQKERIVEWVVEETVRAERSLGNNVLVARVVLDGVGLVGASVGVLAAVFEVGLAWDYIADLPVIPGSTVKGAFRNLLLTRCATLRDTDKRVECVYAVGELLGWLEAPRRQELGEIARLIGLDYETLLGTARRLGLKPYHGVSLLRFYDIHLLCNDEGRLLEPWIINPHYRPGVSTEYDAEPKPVQHVVLAEGLRGYLVVGVSPEAHPIISKISRLLGGGECSAGGCLRFLARLLKATLESGVGARTSRGYTSFRVEDVYMG